MSGSCIRPDGTSRVGPRSHQRERALVQVGGTDGALEPVAQPALAALAQTALAARDGDGEQQGEERAGGEQRGQWQGGRALTEQEDDEGRGEGERGGDDRRHQGHLYGAGSCSPGPSGITLFSVMSRAAR